MLRCFLSGLVPVRLAICVVPLAADESSRDTRRRASSGAGPCGLGRLGAVNGVALDPTCPPPNDSGAMELRGYWARMVTASTPP